MENPFRNLREIYTQNPCQTPSVLELLFELEKKYDSIINDVETAIADVDTKLIPINKKIANLELNQSNIYVVLQDLQDQIDDILSESGTTIYDDGSPLSSINIDSEPTEDSNNLLKSGGVYNALQGKQDNLTFDNTPTEDSNNPVKSGGIYNALQVKQNTLTFDNSPTEDSNNPVKSGGVYNALLDQHPVGCVYISTNSTSPASLFGGSWSQIKDTFLLTAGDTYANGTTGGEAIHTLTITEMPSHSHNGLLWQGNESPSWHATADSGSSGRARLSMDWNGGGSNQFTTGSKGSDGGHNNMPPYLVVYAWKRTA